MSSPPLFPILPGQGWSVFKRPTFSTRVASHVSGREVRSPAFTQTLYEFELTFDALSSATNLSGVGAQSLQTLLGFVLQCQGQYGTFVFVDSNDTAVTAQAVGHGDGATTTFMLPRTLGGFTEYVSWVTAIAAVYVNGSSASGWSLVQPNGLSFTTPPAAGATISADFTYGFLCRFLDDTQDFENIMNGLWQVKSLKFRSVKP